MTTSPLGEYIHLSNENYLKYGTARFGEPPQSPLLSYRAQKRKNDKVISQIKDINPSVLSDLEKALSDQKGRKEIQAMTKASMAEEKEIENFSKRLVDS